MAVKDKYALWVTPSEREAIARVLQRCPDEPVPQDSGAPTSVTLNIHDPYDDPSAPADGVAYENCDDARAAGAAPIKRGDPGYGPHLDRDGDGTGCD